MPVWAIEKKENSMTTTKNEFVYQTCLLLVRHFRNIENSGGVGYHSRIFEHTLHPEFSFVGIGQSVAVTRGEKVHPEHVVPCAFMIEEIKRLITENKLSDAEIAQLLQKHWKIARISKGEAELLDKKKGGLDLKSKMPPGWRFETGETLARLQAGKITLTPIE